jgi:CheY-like chemotaxis protein
MNNLKTILLAEDNPNDVELTFAAMSEFNIANQIVVARDGVEVMEYLRYEGKFKHRQKGNPAVVLLDIKMPRMDGIEVLQHIKNDSKFRTIPVVMLTSSREEPDLKKCYELGVNAYVVKPVDFKEFVEAVKLVGNFWAIINELPTQGETN